MKKLSSLLVVLMCLMSIRAFSQQKTVEVFKPAEAHRSHYDALYVLRVGQ